jgi:hypothetical protein
MLMGRVSQQCLKFSSLKRHFVDSINGKYLELLLLLQLLSRQLRALDTVGDLLESNVSSEVWTAMFRLDIDTEWRESAIIGGAQLINRNIFGGL